MRANWSKEETDLLKKIYSVKTANELKEFFPQYSNTQILRKAKQLGLKKMPEVAKQSRLQNSIIQRNDLWTDEEKQIVIKYYKDYGAKKVVEMLDNNRSEEMVKKIAYKLGLQRERKELIWENTKIDFNKNNPFSIEVTFKGW